MVTSRDKIKQGIVPNMNIEEDYQEMVQRSQEVQPGINELLDLYGQLQGGINLSQYYLQLTQPAISSHTSNSTSQEI